MLGEATEVPSLFVIDTERRLTLTIKHKFSENLVGITCPFSSATVCVIHFPRGTQKKLVKNYLRSIGSSLLIPFAFIREEESFTTQWMSRVSLKGRRIAKSLSWEWCTEVTSPVWASVSLFGKLNQEVSTIHSLIKKKLIITCFNFSLDNLGREAERKFRNEIPLHVTKSEDHKEVIVRMGARNVQLLHSWGACCPEF